MNALKKFYLYLKKDSWDSWLVSLILILIFIRFIFFPILSIATGSPLPLVVIESCSMYHGTNFNSWWSNNEQHYQNFGIEKEDFTSFSFKNGLNKGDIILSIGRKEYKKGDIIIFNSPTTNPLIHRIVNHSPLSTKGDHNTGQLPIEINIPEKDVFGKAVVRIPAIGWLKLVFYEPFRDSGRGLCK